MFRLLLLLILSVPPGVAAPPDATPTAVEARLASLFGSGTQPDAMPGKSYSVLLQAGGDLDRDGRRDWAGLVRPRNSPTGQRIYVLLQTEDGSYTLAAASFDLLSNCGAAYCGIDALAIVQDSLQIDASANWQGCSDLDRQAFKHIDGQWRLISTHFLRLGAAKQPRVEIDHRPQTGVTLLIDHQSKPARKQRLRLETAPLRLQDYSGQPGMGLPRTPAVEKLLQSVACSAS